MAAKKEKKPVFSVTDNVLLIACDNHDEINICRVEKLVLSIQDSKDGNGVWAYELDWYYKRSGYSNGTYGLFFDYTEEPTPEELYEQLRTCVEEWSDRNCDIEVVMKRGKTHATMQVVATNKEPEPERKASKKTDTPQQICTQMTKQVGDALANVDPMYKLIRTLKAQSKEVLTMLTADGKIVPEHQTVMNIFNRLMWRVTPYKSDPIVGEDVEVLLTNVEKLHKLIGAPKPMTVTAPENVVRVYENQQSSTGRVWASVICQYCGKTHSDRIAPCAASLSARGLYHP
jgi:hypothetical protein